MKSILSFIIVAVCGAVYFVYITPLAADIKTLNVKKENYDEVLMKFKETKTRRDELFIEYNNIPGDDIAKLNKIIPEKFNSVLFVNDVSAIAIRNGLVIKDFKIDVRKPEQLSEIVNQDSSKTYNTSLITFRMVGQYDQFINFMKEVEVSLQLVDITSFTAKSAASAKSGDNSIEFQLEMNTYSMK